MSAPAPATLQRCANCSHFNAAPELLERAIPGLRVMGSAYSSVRSADGVCTRHDRYLSAQYVCADFSGAMSPATAA